MREQRIVGMDNFTTDYYSGRKAGIYCTVDFRVHSTEGMHSATSAIVTTTSV